MSRDAIVGTNVELVRVDRQRENAGKVHSKVRSDSSRRAVEAPSEVQAARWVSAGRGVSK